MLLEKKMVLKPKKFSTRASKVNVKGEIADLDFKYAPNSHCNENECENLVGKSSSNSKTQRHKGTSVCSGVRRIVD
jgi:hypothetical protein